MSESLEERVVAAVGHQYALETEIGRGGMSVVYRARDIRLNRTVAVKVLPPELAYDPAVRVRFTREAQTGAQLSHAHIVPIYDVGERDGLAYFVMAFVSGGSLASLLVREPRQPADEARRILCEIADALAYAHERGVIHRDIKPDNILLDANTGRVMVTDFGIARAMEVGSRLTATGIAVGTPTYMSPEQAEGDREIDGRADIYSLGVVAYQMMTGRVPFTGGNSLALLLKHVTERPRPIVELRPDAPRTLREAIERALMKSPEDRWPTAAALRDALTAGDDAAPAWRADRREPVRYASPVPEGRARERGASRDTGRAESRSLPARRDPTVEPRNVAPARSPTREIVMEQEHLASLTPEQRKDLKLWFGRVNLRERIRIARWNLLFTYAAWVGGLGSLAGVADVPPLILAPMVPIFMSRNLWRRAKSLRAHGLKLRRVFLMPLARWVIPRPTPAPNDAHLAKLAPKEVLESPHGVAIRRAAEERAAIVEIVGKLPKPDRALIPDVEPTVKALVDRVAHVAKALHSLEQNIDLRALDEIDTRIAAAERDAHQSPEGERRLAMLRRQRATIEDLVRRRNALSHQLDTAGLALGNLRLDLIKLRSTGVESALSDVSTATQEARALSREIDGVLDAAAQLREL